jgi:hypothetical protein
MEKIIITRKQYEKLKEVFEMFEQVESIVWTESNDNGIGPKVTIEFKVNITDVESW